ncbi:MAG: ABC transporter ATP-binding protein [Candidatus Glassbacteria bacterium]
MAGVPVELKGFSLSIEGKLILAGIDLRVEQGEYVSIVGPNGAGKTTLLRCINRIVTGGSGEISVFGRPITQYSQRELARRVSYVPQLDGRALPFTAEQFVSLGRYPYLGPFSAPGEEDRRLVREIMAGTGVTELADRRLDTLSGGERQKVFIAAALAQGADLLLLDEPTSFLDYRHQVEVRRLLERLNRTEGKTVLAVTHNLNDAVASCHRVVALKAGVKVFDGGPAELVRRDKLEEIYDTTFVLIGQPGSRLPLVRPGEAG